MILCFCVACGFWARHDCNLKGQFKITNTNPGSRKYAWLKDFESEFRFSNTRDPDKRKTTIRWEMSCIDSLNRELRLKLKLPYLPLCGDMPSKA